MRKLSNEEMKDILWGCTVLGTGGGGSLEAGLAMMEDDFKENRALFLADLDEIPDDRYIATPYGCGAPMANNAEEAAEYEVLPHLEDSSAVLAFQRLEEYFGEKFFAVSSTELGGENTAEALHIACRLGIPIMDGDPAGRSVPELQHSSYNVLQIPIYPLAIATSFGESMILESACNDDRAEKLVRALAVASGNEVGVADHPMKGNLYKKAVIPEAISYAMQIGKVIRKNKSLNKSGVEITGILAKQFKGKYDFRGKVTSFPWETKGGFNIGKINLEGIDDFQGETYEIYFKNENMYAHKNSKLVVSVPDLICMIDETGTPITTPNFKEGDEINILLLPSPEVWKSKRGLDIFGPRSFGFDFDYVPFDQI